MTSLDLILDPYQGHGRDFALANPRCLILDPPGLGKTLQAVAVLDALLVQDALTRALVLVDTNELAEQWLDVLATHVPAADVYAGRKSTDFHSVSQGRGPKVLVLTYAKLRSPRDWATRHQW